MYHRRLILTRCRVSNHAVSTRTITAHCLHMGSNAQELQKIVKSRGDSGSTSLLDSFKKQAEEAAKIPAKVIEAPAKIEPAAPKEAPLPVPLPITKALPQPNSKVAGMAAYTVALHPDVPQATWMWSWTCWLHSSATQLEPGCLYLQCNAGCCKSRFCPICCCVFRL